MKNKGKEKRNVENERNMGEREKSHVECSEKEEERNKFQRFKGAERKRGDP